MTTTPGPHHGLSVREGGPKVTSDSKVIVAVHGRGGSPESMLDLVDRFDRPEWSCLAPTASGGTWYPYSFMAEISRNQPGLSSGLAALSAVMSRLQETDVPTRNIALVGFSQGACLASEYAIRNQVRYGAVIVFSGALIGPPGTRWPSSPGFAQTPVFFGCSDVDSHVPAQRVEESVAAFTAAGAAVQKVLYPDMGHLVNDDEVRRARSLLDGVGT